MSLFAKLSVAVMTIAIASSTVKAADVISTGKIKSIDSAKKTFVFTDLAEKDWTMKFGDSLTINREGTESKSDLKDGDFIHVCYDKGVLSWTAHYILVLEGGAKKQSLVRGTVKGYDATTQELTFTGDGKDTTYTVGKASVRVNMEASKIEDVKIGDKALLIVEPVDSKPTLRAMMVERAK